MKYFAVSDIHSFYTPLICALNEVGFDEDDPNHKLIICGDLMDRGDESCELEQYILRLLEKDRVILIRGNHEDLVMDMIRNFGIIQRDLPYTHHYSNRTVHTMLDLTGTDLYEAMSCEPSAFTVKCKKTPFIQKIIPAMKNYHETDNFIFVHGWIPCVTQPYLPKRYQPKRTYEYNPNWRDASDTDWQRARWFNGMQIAKSGIVEPNKTIICGHWNASFGHTMYENKGSEYGKDADYSPFYSDRIIAIDGCTVVSGKVNCIVIED